MDTTRRLLASNIKLATDRRSAAASFDVVCPLAAWGTDFL